tara:strand:+ start:333 stop:680 length:348 start_codon:yes stop_codon:yes gene_type:complete
MPISITFANDLNVSCQVGDTAYYVPTTTSGGFSINSSSVVEIGVISAINTTSKTITVTNNLVASVPSGAFVLFSKDNKANLSSILGYYASVKLVNNSTTEAELFSVGMDIFESSK